jgi:sarcosine oxidase
MKTYDVIVIGLGAMGGSAAYHCAKRGVSVLGLDANQPHHTLGSSHGATRAIRETYFESPDYVPLCQRSFDLWRELEKQTGTGLLNTAGAIYVGPEGHPMLRGVMSAAETHNLEAEQISRTAMANRFPGFALPEDWQGVFEHRGGVLRADACLQAHADLATTLGADLRFGVAAKSWERTAAGTVVVDTGDAKFEAAAVILTLGPWACVALQELNLPLSARRIPVIHFDARDPSRYDPENMSVYFWATPIGVFAGFPHFETEGIKIMRHDIGDVCTPDTIRRQISPDDIAEVARFADEYMPFANRRVRKTLACMYTMTPDNHFIIDSHPAFENLVYATGFSGHGFKFAPVVGEILADMVLTGGTDHATEFLKSSRFEIAVPCL